MKTALAGVFCMKCCHVLKVVLSPVCRCRSEMKSMQCQWAGACTSAASGATRCVVTRAPVAFMSKGHGLFDDHVGHRHVIVVATACRLDGANFVNHITA